MKTQKQNESIICARAWEKEALCRYGVKTRVMWRWKITIEWDLFQLPSIKTGWATPCQCWEVKKCSFEKNKFKVLQSLVYITLQICRWNYVGFGHKTFWVCLLTKGRIFLYKYSFRSFGRPGFWISPCSAVNNLVVCALKMCVSSVVLDWRSAV